MGEISNGTRILLTQYLLKRLTDGEHALSREELIKRIGGLGTTISSNTIKADIESIKSYNHLIEENQKELLAPFEYSESGYISFETKQKRGAYVKQSYYSDAQLILLSKLLGKGIWNNEKLLDKVLSDVSLYKINHYNLLKDNQEVEDCDSVMESLELVINAINNFSCLSFKRRECLVLDNQMVDSINRKTILIYPTNIDVKDEQIYVVGYQINSTDDFELRYYPLNRITQLKITRAPKNVRAKTNSFKENIWLSNDPLNIEKTNYIDLEVRVYRENKNIFETLSQCFKGCSYAVEQFRAFSNIKISKVPDNQKLIDCLIQLGNNVEVIRPVELRNKIKDKITAMYSIYR